MKRRRVLAILLCAVTGASMLAGCGSSSSSGTVQDSAENQATTATDESDADQSESADTSDEPEEFYMFINGPEYADKINELIDEYKTVKPNVTINYETTQNDYPTMLKAKLNAGELPDIFASTAGKEIDLYKEYSLDLTGQPVQEAMTPAVQASMTDSSGNGCYGFHYGAGEYGIIYNWGCFEKAGIEEAPKTLDELKDDCEKLKAVGIQPFACGYAEWWVFKQSLFPFMTEAVDNYGEFVNAMSDGTESLNNYDMMKNNMFEFVDIVKANCESKPLESDLNAMETAVATGQAAMGLGMGAWAESSLLAINPEMDIRIGGYPVSDDPAKCQIAIGADQSFHINKDSEHKQACLDFVNWWFTSDYGKQWLIDIGGYPSIDTDGVFSGKVAQQGAEITAKDGAGVLGTAYCSDAFWQAFGEAFQSYVEGSASKEETISKIDADWPVIDGAQ